MLLCTNPLLSPIRIAARVHQATIATKLQRESTSSTEQHYIEQFTLASWLGTSPTTARIWTGMWTQDTLVALFPQQHDMLSQMCKADRYKYRRITRLLTAPLLDAYKQMIRTSTNSPVLTPAFTSRPPISGKTKHRTSLLLHQSNSLAITNNLAHLYMSPNSSHTAYSYSDAAFSLTDEEIGTRIQ